MTDLQAVTRGCNQHGVSGLCILADKYEDIGEVYVAHLLRSELRVSDTTIAIPDDGYGDGGGGDGDGDGYGDGGYGDGGYGDGGYGGDGYGGGGYPFF